MLSLVTVGALNLALYLLKFPPFYIHFLLPFSLYMISGDRFLPRADDSFQSHLRDIRELIFPVWSVSACPLQNQMTPSAFLSGAAGKIVLATNSAPVHFSYR
ncbi:hypothetical protein Dimus_015440 [Dionaea muscipula]